MGVLQDFRHAVHEFNEWLHHVTHRDTTVFVRVTYANGDFMTSVFKDQLVKVEQHNSEFDRRRSRAAQDTSMRDEFNAFAKLSAQEQRNSVKRFRQQAKRLIEGER